MFRAAVFAGACVVFWSGSVSAQDADAPPLELRPSLEVGSVVSSNADRARGGDGADVGLRLAPSVELQSNWSRHALRAQIDAELIYFLGNDDIATTDVSAASDLRIDVRRDTRADLTASYDLQGNRFETSATDETLAGGIALAHDMGGLEVRGAFEARQKNFESGSDYLETRGSLRGTFFPAGQFRPFIELGYAPRFHDNDALDSEGWDIAAGVAFDRTPFLTGEIAARWLKRSYDDSDIGTVDALGLSGQLAWTPTDLTRITVGAGLDIDDDAGGASRTWSAELRAEHEVNDYYSVFAGLDAEVDDGTSGTDYAIGSDLGMRWTFNRYMGVVLAYQNEFSFGGQPSDDFSDHRLIASLLLTR
jgi:hypothetical protein